MQEVFDDKDLDFNFYIDPFKTIETEIACFAKFDDYNALLD